MTTLVHSDSLFHSSRYPEQNFDLKVFFTVVPKPPGQVTVDDVLAFIEGNAHHAWRPRVHPGLPGPAKRWSHPLRTGS